MNREEEFKQSLENILDSKSFAFDEANWAEARRLMDARRRRRRLLIWLPAALLVGVAGLYLLWPQNNSAIISLNAEKTLPTTAKEPDYTTQTQAISKPASSPEAVIVPVPQAEPDPLPEIKAKETIATLGDHQEKTPDKTETDRNNADSDTPVSDKGPDLTNQKKQQSSKATLPPDPEGVSNNDTLTKPTEKNTPETDEKKVTSLAKAPETKQSPLSENKISEPSAPGDSVVKPQPPAPLPIASTATAAGDSTKPAPQNPTITPAYFVLLEGGASYLLGWKNPSGRDANGLNPTFGLHLQNRFSKTMGLSVGVQYQSVRNLLFSSKESRLTRYGLGEESHVTIITPVRAHYIYFPLKLSYYTPANEFGLGYNMGYLLNVESKVETFEWKQNSRSNYQSYVTAGYTEGFSIFDSQINLFYRRRIYKELYLNTELFLGIKDVKNNVFFTLAQTEHNSGIRISLLYTMFKK